MPSAATTIADTPAAEYRGRWCAPWIMLVRPALAWEILGAEPRFGPGLLAQWLVLGLGWIISALARSELSDVAGLSVVAAPSTTGGFLASLLALAALLLLANLVLAGAAVVIGWLLGLRLPLARTLSWAAHGLMPYVLGTSLGLTLFAIVRPINEGPAEALALLLKPYSLGLATWLPAAFPPLSFHWFLASYTDVFFVWSLICLVLGLRRLLGLTWLNAAWLTLSLMLLWGIALSGLWRSVQLWLISLTG